MCRKEWNHKEIILKTELKLQEQMRHKEQNLKEIIRNPEIHHLGIIHLLQEEITEENKGFGNRVENAVQSTVFFLWIFKK